MILVLRFAFFRFTFHTPQPATELSSTAWSAAVADCRTFRPSASLRAAGELPAPHGSQRPVSGSVLAGEVYLPEHSLLD